MNILSFDGSNNNLCLSIERNGVIIVDDVFVNINNQSEKLVCLIDENLKKLKLKYEDLDFVAIANGPANFTGIRVAFTIAKMINLIAGVRVITVGSLESFAYEYKDKANKILAVIDAKLAEFFVQEFAIINDDLTVKSQAKILKKSQILAFLLENNNFLLVGNCDFDMKNIKKAQKSNLIHCRNIIALAKKKYSQNKTNFEKLSYLREPSVSQRK